ncbi:MAG: HAMP domain-containing sensor histidine kinase [Roseiflexaceae bacterium]
MMKFQQDHEDMAALMDLMLATNEAGDPRALANQALDWLIARDGIVSSGVWLAPSNDLLCLAWRNLDPDDVMPVLKSVLDTPASAPLTLVYQQDLRLTILPLGVASDQRGALVVISQAPPDPDQLLLLRAVAAHLAATITRPRLWSIQSPGASERIWEEFLAHAAHEIKNPLASIKGYADLLMRRVAKDPADPYRKGLATISQQVGRTTTLLDQISDITRLGAGALFIDRHATDFALIVDRVIQDYQSVDQQHTIIFDRVDTELAGRFDQVRIAQVISAIISNALKFSVDGGVVSIQLRRSGTDAGASGARLSVSDTGVGVPAGEQERIFERFFRGSNVRGTYAGLGVGLYIARAVVDLHGGRIWLESQPGLKTTCHVALPLAA